MPTVDWDRGDIILGDESWHLTPKEMAIFRKLAERPGKPVSKRQLLDELYGDDPNGGPDWGSKIIEMHVSNLRKKCPWRIQTRYGYGYSIEGYP